MSMMSEEIGKKWTLIGIGIELISAYIISFIVYNLAFAVEIFGLLAILAILGLVIILFAIIFVVKFVKTKKCTKDCLNCRKNCK